MTKTQKSALPQMLMMMRRTSLEEEEKECRPPPPKSEVLWTRLQWGENVHTHIFTYSLVGSFWNNKHTKYLETKGRALGIAPKFKWLVDS